jgi:ligand-binding SRPBCC domain-containing protein
MPTIHLTTTIHAPIHHVFDLSRSIDLHQISTEKTQEKAIAGKTSGLIELHETVTWRAKHFGIYQTLTTKITAFDKPNYFVDEMVQGAFKSFVHTHKFEDVPEGTIMTDVFDYQSPLGILGKLADVLFLKNYMRRFLMKRNEVIKVHADNQNAYL